VVVLRHTAEQWKSTNTVRWAGLALSNFEVHTYGGREDFPAEALRQEGTWLLFPGNEGAPLPEVPPKRLLVLDGTWRQVRRMYHATGALHGLPRLSLGTLNRPALAAPPMRRLRAQGRPNELSTLEAIAHALARLEGGEAVAPLWTLYAQMVEGTNKGRGRL
jgi:DTW domain-containing protein YfiP